MYTNSSLFNPYRDLIDIESLEKGIQEDAEKSRYLSAFQDTSIYGEFLEFDTQIFKKRAAVIKGFSVSDKKHITHLSECLKHFLDILIKDHIEFVICKIHHNDIGIVRIFENAGFNVMSCQQQYRFDFSRYKIPQLNDACHIRMGDVSDAGKVAKLSRECFKTHFDQFHNDPLLDNSCCDDLHEKWGRNSFFGFADAVMIAETDGKVVGFVTLKKNGKLDRYSKKKIGDLVLLGVAPRYRKLGIHTSMVRHGLLYWKEKADLAEIVTEANNIPALRTYSKLRFTPSSCFLVMHKHL